MTPAEAHLQLLGKNTAPTELQAAFYATAAKGFASGDTSEEAAVAVMMSALAQVIEKGGPLQKVFLFCAPSERKLLTTQIWNTGRIVMERVSGAPDPVLRSRVLKHIRSWLSAPLLGPVEDWKKSTAPERWVVFGYGAESKIPSWMRDQLT